MNRPLKILQVCAIDTTAWILLRVQLEGMRDHGWDVHVACSDGPNLPRLRELGITTHAIPIARNTDVRSHLVSIWRLWQLIRRERFDVVHVHTPVASLIGRLAARFAGTPVVLYTAHGFYFHEGMPARQRARHVWLERTFGRLTDFLFTQAEEDAATAAAEGIMPAERVKAIGNGVWIESFQTVAPEAVAAWRAKLGIPDGAVVAGIVGRVVEEKGFREYFEAARMVAERHPEAAFLVVGGAIAGDRDGFEAEVARYLADPILQGRVFFSGFTEEIPVLVNLMDIFALPSYREGMPRSIIEAMAAGKPVVATNIRGCREEVVEGETGYLVPVKDAAVLAERLERLVADPALRARLGEAGRKRAEACFHERDVVTRVVNGIQAVADAKLGIVPVRPQPGKRLFDLLLAVPAFVLFLPLMLLVALGLALTTGRPVLFAQDRPGVGGKIFKIYKFRSMTDARDEHGNLLPDADRLTPVGRFIRKASLDELPQLLNVLRGELSLVGPRPLLVRYLPRYTPEQLRRQSVMPGITGWAQVNGRNAIGWEQKFALDTWYVDHWSLWLDLRILARTVAKVLVREGVSAAGEATVSEFMGTERV